MKIRAPTAIHGGEVWEIRRKLGEKQRIIDFSSSVNPLGPSTKAISAIRKGISTLRWYPDPDTHTLRQSLAAHLGVTPENILVGNGSTELIFLFAELLSDGDKVLIPQPTFSEYERATLKAGAEPVFFNLKSDLTIDHKVIRKFMNTDIKALFLCNPNNPTSIAIPRGELLKIVDEVSSTGAILFVDEDFLDFVDENASPSLVKTASENSNVFVVRSFTKFFALAGLRVGYCVASQEIISKLSRLKPPWSVNSLAQSAADASLQDKVYFKKSKRFVKEEKEFLYRELSKFNGLKVLHPDANFILARITGNGLTAAKLKEKLLDYGILIRDCSSFRGLDERYVRFAVNSRSDNLLLLRALRRILV